jgi:hypothetical protein
VSSWLVFSAVRSVKGFLLRPKVFSKSVVGMSAAAVGQVNAVGLMSTGTCQTNAAECIHGVTERHGGISAAQVHNVTATNTPGTISQTSGALHVRARHSSQL